MKELRVMYKAAGASLFLGTLAHDGRDLLFQYSADALAREIELSPIRLPLRAIAYPDNQKDYLDLMQVPGLIYDSLPDGWGLLLMDRRMRARGIKTDEISVLDRLAYLGENTMGALTYEPSDKNMVGQPDLTLLEIASEIRALLYDESHAVLAELARVGGSPGGIRPKAVVYYNPDTNQMSTHDGRVSGGQPWLFKFPAREDAPDSCAMEELYARIAHRCGLGMEPTKFIQLPNGLTAFGSKRFDRDAAGQRVHVHSLAGLLHADFRIPSLGYTEFMQVTRRLTRDKRESIKALQRCVFNVLMNNRDDHAKNLSFLLNKNNDWVLAPPYDLTYCPGSGGEHFMDIAGEGKNPSRADILKLARAGGLTDRDATSVIDEILGLVTDVDFRNLARLLPIENNTVDNVAKIVDANRRRLVAA
ncbi:MAG TPA: type II toxin-antitoxin system HipA family toxin [Janthinobacterium sp.]|nr:type II toxin-antitoxin system HipA family toxin [Janthinobacterium sp.]